MSEVKITKELFAQAIQCKDADELIALCKENGIELTMEQAEKFLTQVKEQELTLDNIEDVAGGQFCAGAVSIPCLGIGI